MSDLASTSEKDGGMLGCPFCGGEASPTVLADGTFWRVECGCCPADMAGDDPDAARRNWNRRASPAPAESGEPVAWRYISSAKGAKWTVQKNYPDQVAKWDGYMVEPLYAHPPAGSAGSPSTSGVGVTKPLEWSSEAPYGVARVPKIGLMYSTEAVWYEGIFQHVELLGSASGRFPTVAAARVAAQADYEARIRSALVYPSDPSRDTQPALLSTDETKEGGNG